MRYWTVSLRISFGIALCFLCACGTPQPTTAPTESPTEAVIHPTDTPIPWTHPSGRAHHQMVYNADCERILLLGGAVGNYDDPANGSNEVWSYEASSNSWEEMTPWSGPQPMTAVAAAYDEESKQVILFGGGVTFSPISRDDDEHLTLDENWAYDCKADTWVEMASGPRRRVGLQMVYHTPSDRIIVFGGNGGVGMNDTWTYDFNSDTWIEMQPETSPPRRWYHSMAYDVESDKVLVWGGKDLPDKNIWAYDFNSNSWEKMTTSEGPVNRNYPAMAYDASADRVIMYGGLNKDDTWSYDYNTNTWTELSPDTNPGKLARHALVYDPEIDRTILFGGRYFESDIHEFMDETWMYDFNTNTWTNMTPDQ